MPPRKPPVKKSLSSSLWHVALGLMVLLCVAIVVAIVLRGATPTDELVNDGRRVIITLSTGEIRSRASDPAKPKPAADAPATSEEQTGEGALSVPITPTVDALPGVNPDLQEVTPGGNVPKIGADGTKPWRYYSRPFESRAGRPVIAVIVSGVGQNQNNSTAALNLPADVTISLSPYAPDVSRWAIAARATGHEVLLDMPVQGADYPASDPGPLSLLIGQSMEVNLDNLQKIMGLAQAYSGFLLPQHEAFSSEVNEFKYLLQELNNHGLMLVLGSEPHKTETRDTVETTTTPTLIADKWIDEDPSQEAIQARFAEIEVLAKKRGYAIAVARALPLTLDQLREWSNTLAAKGMVIVPVTFIAKPRFS